jgi:DnaK suppressor protein
MPAARNELRAEGTSLAAQEQYPHQEIKMSELAEADLRDLQRRLDQREAQLQAEVRSGRAAAGDKPSAVPRSHVQDDGEVAEERMRGAVRHADEERDIEELRQIEAARERMAQDRYGRCVDCDADIPLARLQAQPAAERCLGCQEAYEQAHPAKPRLPPELGSRP